MNRDLAEVRRFWPKAVELDFCGPLYVARPVRRHELTIAESADGSWFLHDWRGGCAYHKAPTIAAAMAAAGFVARKVGMHRSLRLFLQAENRHPWNPEDWKPRRTPLQSRQRPRKGVRLGGKARRLACWMAIYRDSSLVTAAQVRANY